MAESLGHNVPVIFMLVFGAGTGLAGLAGVIGGSTFVTEPSMAATVGPIIFVVVVVGGLGSLSGAFLASLLIGVIQTFAIAFDFSVGGLTLSQIAPVLPYLLLVLVLVFRPKGLLGQREG
jgi:branched-chain amino acid transport system permease protein